MYVSYRTWTSDQSEAEVTISSDSILDENGNVTATVQVWNITGRLRGDDL